MIDCNNDAPQAPAFLMNRKDLVKWFSSPSLVKQMIKANWIQPFRKGKPGREALYEYEVAKSAYERLQAGDDPGAQPGGEPLKAGQQ